MSDQSFRYEDGHVIGYGMTIPATDGRVILNADLLNRLIALLRERNFLGDDDGARIVAQEKREHARIEAAKADLIEDLGLDEETHSRR
jgi:hypothetical protein